MNTLAGLLIAYFAVTVGCEAWEGELVCEHAAEVTREIRRSEPHRL
jgi:hypothetical protein